MVAYTEHKSYHVKTQSSVALSTLSSLYSRHHHSLPRTFSSSPTETLYPLSSNYLYSSPRPVGATILFFSLWLWWLWVPHTSGITQYLSCCNWPVSQTVMSSGLIHVVLCWPSFLPSRILTIFACAVQEHKLCTRCRTTNHSFLRLNGIPRYLARFVYPFVIHGRLACFYLLAFVNNAAESNSAPLLFLPSTSLNDCRTPKRRAFSPVNKMHF